MVVRKSSTGTYRLSQSSRVTSVSDQHKDIKSTPAQSGPITIAAIEYRLRCPFYLGQPCTNPNVKNDKGAENGTMKSIVWSAGLDRAIRSRHIGILESEMEKAKEVIQALKVRQK